jgi:hypothetical protein
MNLSISALLDGLVEQARLDPGLLQTLQLLCAR